jgi:hypothetical protein
MALKKIIEIKFTKEGVHKFPGADTDPKYATGGWDDVSFLGKEHFHYFYYVVQVEVGHSNREIEFIQFNRWCQRLYSEGTLKHDHKSCEMLAEELIEQIKAEYGDRWIKVSVLEDNINGAHVEYSPPQPALDLDWFKQVISTNIPLRGRDYTAKYTPIPMGDEQYLVTWNKPDEE